MYLIEIKKENLPYKEKVVIKDKVFYLELNYNIYDSRVYATLLDIDENILVEDEPIVLGQIMFARYYIDVAGNFSDKFPKALMIPNFYDSANLNKIEYNNVEQSAIYIQEID